MTPTNKFSETVKKAAQEKQVSEKSSHKERQGNEPKHGSLENIAVVLSKINYIIEQAFNESDPENIS